MRGHHFNLKILLLAGLCFLFSGLPKLEANESQQAIDKMIESNLAHLESFFSHSQSEAMRNLLGSARALFVAPEITSGGFLVGMQKGKGMLFRRHGQKWSDPVFMSLSEWNIGLQAGVMESSIIMLIMTDKATDDLINGLGKLSGTGGFALGGLGMGATGSGGVKGGLEVITISTSKGAFLGSVMGDQEIKMINSMNEEAYGPDPDITKILSQPGGSLSAAKKMQSYLEKAVIKSWDQK